MKFSSAFPFIYDEKYSQLPQCTRSLSYCIKSSSPLYNECAINRWLVCVCVCCGAFFSLHHDFRFVGKINIIFCFSVFYCHCILPLPLFLVFHFLYHLPYCATKYLFFVFSSSVVFLSLQFHTFLLLFFVHFLEGWKMFCKRIIVCVRFILCLLNEK